MAITKSTLPDQSLLNADGKTYDFVDSFEGDFFDNRNISSTEVGKLFFSTGPKWIDKLFALRNKLVKFLGLKTSGKISDRAQLLKNFQCEEGQQLGLFKVFSKTADEIVLGEDDRHLDFRVSLFIVRQTSQTANSKLIISTTVKFNNWFGRLYFIPVRPFHKLIVPAMLKGIIKAIEKPN